jgi:hypothetical protein
MTPAAHFGISRSLPDPGPDFPTFGLGRRLLYMRRDFTSNVPMIFARLGEIDRSAVEGAGNRKSGFALKLESGPELYARRALRGGLVRFLLNDIYVGLRPRPVRELAIAAEAQRRGIAVAEPLGAMVEWIAPGAYRGIFLTRAMMGMTLWDFIRTDDDAYVRTHVLEQSRRAIDTMHQLGLFHADLNLQNLFVTKSGESFMIVILDLDKAKLFDTAVSSGLRKRNLARLRRSARKLDPEGRYLDPHALVLLAKR